MFRISSLFCMSIAILTAGMLFNTSQSVQRAEQDLSVVQEKLENEKESLRVLTAEWDYLNRPERLEKLTLDNLDVNESLSEKENFIDGEEAVPEPLAPILPPAKPKDLMRYVSMQREQQEQGVQSKNKSSASRFVQASDVIKNSEKENFSKLVQSDSAENSAGEQP